VVPARDAVASAVAGTGAGASAGGRNGLAKPGTPGGGFINKPCRVWRATKHVQILGAEPRIVGPVPACS